MDWLYPIALRVIAGVALIYFGLGLFNVHWLLRLRIIAALSMGALIVGAAGYPLVSPADPVGAISFFTGEISAGDGVLLMVLGLVAGAVATLVCFPLGSVLGPFAAPTGVAVLAMASGDLRQILLTHSGFEQRSAMYAFLRWELLFWLGICAAGYLGVFLTSRLLKTKPIVLGQEPKPANKANYWTNCGIAAFIAAAIVYFTIGIFAQDLRQLDEQFGYVVGHPGHRQIAFGVFVSVGLAGFAAKQFLQVHYLPVILGAGVVYIGTFTKIADSDTLQYMVQTWPIDFFTKSIYAILPIQFAPFAVLGAMTGYWVSIYYKNRPDHED